MTISFQMRTHIQELVHAGGLFIAVFLVLHFSVQNFRIDGKSMEPALIDEQHVIVSKVAYISIHLTALQRHIPFLDDPDSNKRFLVSQPPEYGDIVALIHPMDTSIGMVKRVIGLPGDVIEIDAGQVIRNGELLNELYVVNSDRRTFKPISVPPGFYYVLGDNRRVSGDSRIWGFVPAEHIIGRVSFTYWPSDKISFLHSLRKRQQA